MLCVKCKAEDDLLISGLCESCADAKNRAGMKKWCPDCAADDNGNWTVPKVCNDCIQQKLKSTKTTKETAESTPKEPPKETAKKCRVCEKETNELISGRCENCIVAQSQSQLYQIRTVRVHVPGDTDDYDNDEEKGDGDADASVLVLGGGAVVNKHIAGKLDPHQREGVEFIWNNCFSDFFGGSKEGVNGAILAHHMGLGKSLTSIAVLHTAINACPIKSEGGPPKKVANSLLVAPSTTLVNWEEELSMWTGPTGTPLLVFNLSSAKPGYRQGEISKWKNKGGILLMSEQLFVTQISYINQNAPPDMIVVDEAHRMLKNSKNKSVTSMHSIKTSRKILLTGTPLQNNILEFYNLVECVRPGFLGLSEREFTINYCKPIQKGMYRDSSDNAKATADELQKELYEKCRPFVHRKDASLLKSILPELHDTLLTIQSSCTQDNLIKQYDDCCEGKKDKNFFRRYHTVAPILNHPGCLKFGEGEGNTWLKLVAKPRLLKKLHHMWRSPKFIILAHLLALADQLGEKTLIYSQSLNTLDLVEELLKSPDWKRQIRSLDYRKIGGWKHGSDYMRIDGSVESGERGKLVKAFNGQGQAKAFLISSLAGGIGINLTAATRVVMLDNHFSPSISAQCIARAWRRGQDKPVHAYRFAIEGSMETKVYKRSENKAVVSSGVVDGEDPLRNFSQDECKQINRLDCWATCHECDKKRLLDKDDRAPDPEEWWYCGMIGRTCEQRADFLPLAAVPSNLFATEDSVLLKLKTIVNKRTRKTALVVRHDEVQSSEVAYRKDVGSEIVSINKRRRLSGP